MILNTSSLCKPKLFQHPNINFVPFKQQQLSLSPLVPSLQGKFLRSILHCHMNPSPHKLMFCSLTYGEGSPLNIFQLLILFWRSPNSGYQTCDSQKLSQWVVDCSFLLGKITHNASDFLLIKCDFPIKPSHMNCHFCRLNVVQLLISHGLIQWSANCSY